MFFGRSASPLAAAIKIGPFGHKEKRQANKKAAARLGGRLFLGRAPRDERKK